MPYHETLLVSTTGHCNIGRPISLDMAIDSATPTLGLLILGHRQVIRLGTLHVGSKVDNNVLTSEQPDSKDVQVLIKCCAHHPHPMKHSRTHKQEREPITFR
ncbi:hypothetical protein E2562_020092 [Oryza meyeriana var. granulata]|uniref:Uncharacterized protein n=1 Tax=Oryza meyeriana var. granulata TaxID=110450 RepID=A0A6G1EAI3_9ORYZ|nr:hypothetical protein E2562_020092 [Oryza meyeriana var. granulata]